ncbi:YcnI family copper-binding membrane protein [Subtercola boreus]|uniref:YncI copper-binding domain-containing protein n=1 Tax=Subtercola boreus TaxID=120213 RepID=A0A3E0WEU7_9MICO|nr:YcnI family protein [Subtercola boreus]RFA22558.1 hypothetical protein B7R24_02730 [Subtercola boreus]RFA22914.1 hypothetical protein B7R23_02725 [Subtercola boreus]RFA28665.1 hypothetical protein B7R25_02740 [Subtercola boreus]
MKKSTIARAAASSGIALALTLAAPLAASAHVHVDPDRAAPGSYSTLTFKVPTESATASTVRLEVDLPTDTPFGSVSYQPVAGWSVQVVEGTLATPVTTDDSTVTEAPTQIIWTADAATAGAATGIAPGQFELFSISAGPIPDTGSIALPTHQTYSDGSVVDWVDAPLASGAEPEHPAPVLYITDAPPVSEEGAAGTSGTATVSPGAGSDSSGGAVVTQGTAVVDSSSSTVSVIVAIAALVLAAIALVVSVVAVTRRSGQGRA